jgi:alpha-glucosidase (family GH31 glycosyl hydrolase)
VIGVAPSWAFEEQVLVGPHILVRPVLEPLVDSVQVYFPGGVETSWHPLWPTNDRETYIGGTIASIRVSLDSIPMFVRAGSVIPMKEQKRKTTFEMKSDPYSLVVFLDSNRKAQGDLYMDDEETMRYLEGDYALIKIEYRENDFDVVRVSGNRYVDTVAIENVRVYENHDLTPPGLEDLSSPGSLGVIYASLFITSILLLI